MPTSLQSIRLNFVPAALAVLLSFCIFSTSLAQENLTPNGIRDERENAFALTNVSIYEIDGEMRQNSTLLLRDGRIVEIVDADDDTDGYFVIDMSGYFVYPGFIDIFTGYGVPELEEPEDNVPGENLYPSGQALNVNDAIRANFRASTAFVPDEDARDAFRKLGFSTVASFRADGIARGTSALITLGDESANEAVIQPDVAAHYSLDKGTSIQSMPTSVMGSFALLRQTYLDAQWFGQQDPRPFTDETLESWLRYQTLPQIMAVENWQLALTADKIGDEFDTQFILATSGDSYQRADLIAATDATLIVPLDFPDAPEVADALAANEVSLAELKHWELAPFNSRILAENGIPFVFTSSDADEDFLTNLRTAVSNGLSPTVAIDALTRIPAELLGAEDDVGQLAPGNLANLLITNGDLFAEDTLLLENWIKGERHVLATDFDDRAGQYALDVNGRNFELTLSFDDGDAEASLLEGEVESSARVELTDDLIALNFEFGSAGNRVRLNGWPAAEGWQGNGRAPDGSLLSWTMRRIADSENSGEDEDSDAADAIPELPSAITYPFVAYGRESAPVQQDMLIRNATVWTNEDMGTLVTDVLVRDGEVEAIGSNLSANNALVIDGTDKHLTAGIVDEHSHLALFNINEGQTNSSMVRMKDVVDSEDVNIYRNLAGGVTAAQLLHGSANPIGGQSAIIKMKWGEAAPGLIIQDADEFIKFALGENVKRSTSPSSIRYPQTRMGVEQVFVNAFSQAQEYGRRWEEYENLSGSARRNTTPPRRDLVNEAMLEILNGERWVTSHSYVQSEINMLMHVAESFDFNINTFTHILEGYKVADKMAQHGAGGSTFSDWFGYKWEVRYAIPYNAALMQQAGVVVAINSDDREMSRRLNQEAAKAIKYGNMSEVDALKMVTLNPSILLHLDDRMGSIAEGKDADLVLWSDHPLSVYAVAETTWIEGAPYYDREEDAALRQQIADERARIIASIINDSSK